MLTPAVKGQLLFYRKLNVSGNLDGVYALAWRMTDDRDEAWSKRFDAFKYAKQPAIRGACKVLPEALDGLRLSPSPVTLVSAIPSGETALPKNHALQKLGIAVSDAMGWGWLPEALSKKKHRKLVEIKQNADERDAEVRDAYTAIPLTGAKCCVILDDFVTRGATMNDAARAVRASSPSVKHVYGLVLGKNESRGWAGQCGIGLDNDHLPPDLLAMWDSA